MSSSPMSAATGSDETPNIINEESVLGPEWCGVFESTVDFKQNHFEVAMSNLIKQPNINSTVILRTDILKEIGYDNEAEGNPVVKDFLDKELINSKPELELADGTTNNESSVLEKNLDDLEIREIPCSLPLIPKSKIVRRIIPRNPFKDFIINQTCLVLTNNNEQCTLVVYIPHIDNEQDSPFYLPPVYAVGILFMKDKLSLHYLPFNYTVPEALIKLKKLEPSERPIRIAFRLLQTAKKHSTGVMNGYQKRVQHDLVVSKVAFQDRYIYLKKKYCKELVENWCESTDPKKHVFEDIAIAAFLIELWIKIYNNSKDSFEFRDLGCGNGLLVHILTLEGYKGIGIDARARKSWKKAYPVEVQQKLKEQVVIPSVLLRPHPVFWKMNPHIQDNGRIFQIPINNNNNHGNAHNRKKSENGNDDIDVPIVVPDGNVPIMAYYSSANLLQSPQVNTAEFPKNTFIIGNHSDELTCWIPLLGYPFMVIPCCSHALNGARVRYTPSMKKRNIPGSSSTYASLCDKVEQISEMVGWKVQHEMLRIPSTRNMAIIGYEKFRGNFYNIYDVLAMEGSAEGWVENSMALMKRAPRNH
ncbi:hypothetical protein PACTADRAFT_50811 [Pachysolen tannophilus NRRL Y-2460]|uniref:tRNA (uracil-O(2)-)-methyltransferase n=1 Tax=Pachysolen tannophilus NRRL Y-2460 TaxID=669874 RepID=A0A1E4TTC7_PACTA|nr:hypothetical protein PACTADRAFT_50811 [Pachysolen tannophilus NRRL Y-2460]